MPLTSGHNAPRIETKRADEQAAGVAAPGGSVAPLQPVKLSRSSGRIADRQTASELGGRGGRARAAKARQLRALEALGLRGATPEVLRPFLDDANQFAAAEVERLARECGGGQCPQNAAALVQQAALAMAASRAAYSAGDTASGARLGVEVRQNLLAARELTVLEAKSRPQSPGDAHARAAEQLAAWRSKGQP